MAETLPKLTGKQAKYLRGLGHPLKPILRVGKSGVTGALIKQTASALETHELIKMKLLQSCPETIKEVAASVTERVPCQLAQSIGKTLLLYKKREENPKIVLPENKLN